MSKKKGMLFVQGADRPGIIKEVTGILFQSGANLEDVSMTILENQFAMMVSFQAGVQVWKKISEQTAALKKNPWHLHTDLTEIGTRKTKKNRAGKSVLITAIGRDRTGIVYRLSSDLAKMKANITNLDSRLLSGGKTALYSLMLEIDLKKSSDESKISRLIGKWSKELGVEVKSHLSESAVF